MCPGAFSPPNHQPDNTAIGTPSDFLSLVRVPRLMKPEQFRQIERSVGWPRCWRCLLRNPTMAPTCRERNHKKAMENGPFIEDFPIKTSIYIIWLVVWNMAFMTFHILGRTIPTDELICFSWVDDKTWHTSGLPQLDSSLEPRPQVDCLHPLLLTTCPILDDKATEIFPSFLWDIFFITTPNLVANTISSIFDLLLQTEHVKPQMPSEKCATKTVGR